MTDIGHGRGWLNADAAASLRRVDAQIGHPLQVTDAGRTWEQQAELRRLYEAGRGSFAALPGESPHEAGNAIDTNERLVEILHDHGWRRPLAFEPWHFVYWPNLDNHINESGAQASAQVAPEEDEMFKLYFITDDVDGNGGSGWILQNLKTGKPIVLRSDEPGAQELANSWARAHNNARHINRQDWLNVLASIAQTA